MDTQPANRAESLRKAFEDLAQSFGDGPVAAGAVVEGLEAREGISPEVVEFFQAIDPDDTVTFNDALVDEISQNLGLEVEQNAEVAIDAESPGRAEPPPVESPWDGVPDLGDIQSQEMAIDSYMDYESSQPYEMEAGAPVQGMAETSPESEGVPQIDPMEDLLETPEMKEASLEKVKARIDKMVEGVGSTEPETIRLDREVKKVLLDIRSMYLDHGESHITANALHAIVKEHNTPPDHPLHVFADYKVETSKDPAEEKISLAVVANYNTAYAKEAARWWSEKKVQEGRAEQRARDQKSKNPSGASALEGGQPGTDEDARLQLEEMRAELAKQPKQGPVAAGPGGGGGGGSSVSDPISSAVSVAIGGAVGVAKGVFMGLKDAAGQSGFFNGSQGAQNAFSMAGAPQAQQVGASDNAVAMAKENAAAQVGLTNSSQPSLMRTIQGMTRNVDQAEKSYASALKAKSEGLDAEPHLLKCREQISKANNGLHKIDPNTLKAMSLPAKEASLTRLNKRLTDLDNQITNDLKKSPKSEKSPNLEKLGDRVKEMAEAIKNLVVGLFKGRSPGSGPGR